MPTRRNVVSRIIRLVAGQLWFDNSAGRRCVTVPHELYEEAELAADTLYGHIVDAVDWSRILIEAQARHLHHDPHGDSYATCGKCLREALLVDVHDGWSTASGAAVPSPPAEHPDWLSALSRLRSKARLDRRGSGG